MERIKIMVPLILETFLIKLLQPDYLTVISDQTHSNKGPQFLSFLAVYLYANIKILHSLIEDTADKRALETKSLTATSDHTHSKRNVTLLFSGIFDSNQ